jgi:hypothetical protein
MHRGEIWLYNANATVGDELKDKKEDGREKRGRSLQGSSITLQ